MLVGLAGCAEKKPALPEATGAAVADSVTDVWQKLGFPLPRLPEQVVVTPACGLAGATPAYARAALTTAVEAARRLTDHAS